MIARVPFLHRGQYSILERSTSCWPEGESRALAKSGSTEQMGPGQL
jgi:hypothetical protein